MIEILRVGQVLNWIKEDSDALRVTTKFPTDRWIHISVGRPWSDRSDGTIRQ
jgi:hypothetical protein